mmetsp:Transcript_58434/g.104989  ORF Transcript_58434/g.104989 Transcript_58434/m.104989 type:complete len:261 (+) Transcript_58434:287-1069(+)
MAGAFDGACIAYNKFLGSLASGLNLPETLTGRRQCPVEASQREALTGGPCKPGMQRSLRCRQAPPRVRDQELGEQIHGLSRGRLQLRGLHRPRQKLRRHRGVGAGAGECPDLLVVERLLAHQENVEHYASRPKIDRCRVTCALLTFQRQIFCKPSHLWRQVHQRPCNGPVPGRVDVTCEAEVEEYDVCILIMRVSKSEVVKLHVTVENPHGVVQVPDAGKHLMHDGPTVNLCDTRAIGQVVEKLRPHQALHDDVVVLRTL